MDTAGMNAAWFSAGVVLQTPLVLLFHPRLQTLGKLCVILAALPAAVFIVRHQAEGAFTGNDLLPIMGIFVFIYAILMRQEVLAPVGERAVLIFTLVFWYTFLGHYPDCSWGSKLFLGLLALGPSVLVLGLAFTRAKPNYYWRVFFYCWFTLLAGALVALQFKFNDLAFFYDDTWSGPVRPLSSVLAGMTFFHLGSQIFNVAFLALPLFFEEDSYAERLRYIREHANLLAKRYDDRQLPLAGSLGIILLGGGGLALNFWLRLVPDYLLVNAVLLARPLGGILIKVSGIIFCRKK